METIKSIKEVINYYDNFIIDQWGVMHDGKFGYEHAFDTINLLSSENKNLFIISNSSKRSISSIDRLPKLGFKKNAFIKRHTCYTNVVKILWFIKKYSDQQCKKLCHFLLWKNLSAKSI